MVYNVIALFGKKTQGDQDETDERTLLSVEAILAENLVHRVLKDFKI